MQFFNKKLSLIR